MSKSIKISKGLDIRLVGEADKVIADAAPSSVFAIKPPDFHGLTPKMMVKEGDALKQGTVIFKDKYNMDINFVSPVAGKVKEIVRGAKRRILAVTIDASGEEVETFDASGLENKDAEEIKTFLCNAGLWPFIKMRPLDVMANPADTPKAIFISGFNSHPLAPDYDFTIRGRDKAFQMGVTILSKLTTGKVNLTLKNGNADPAIKGAQGVVTHKISGPHPAGNVGVQIHHVSPLNKGEVVWTINAEDVATIGSSLLEGKFDSTRLVAVTGANAKDRKYFRTKIGASIKSILNSKIEENSRIVSGDPLTGDEVNEEGHLGFFNTQVTVLPEGDEHKFFLTEGWLSPGLKRFSMSRAYPSWLIGGKKKHNIDTNLNGEERAFVVTEQYEKVFPFDIYPVHLTKAAITNDIDLMEKLGIYEVAPEDFALCEFVCTSKIPVQKTIREGLDLIQSEVF